MNDAGGFITLHRQIIKWEWYTDSTTKDLFLHLLLTASFADTRFLGKKIKRGQVVTSLPKLASETGLSIQNVRTALKHLISTGEITEKVTGNPGHSYRLITVVKYDEFQKLTGKPTDELAGRQQDANRTLTGRQHHNNNINNVNNDNKVTSNTKGFTPPSRDEVLSYIRENNFTVDGDYFFDHYESCGWVLKGGQKMKDWRATIRTWERREKRGRQSGEPGRNNQNAEGEVRGKYSFLRDRVINL